MWRIWFISSTFLILFFIIIARLFYWQVISGYSLKKEASSQYRQELVTLPKRGSIVSSDSYELVGSKNASLVFAEPKRITDSAKFISAIASLLDVQESSLSAALSDPSRVWYPIKHKVDEDTVLKLQQLELTGLGFEKESKRYYPESSMAAHLLGFVGFNQNGQDQGYFGLEGYYNRELSGKSGSISLEKDVTGAPILIGQSVRIEPEDGSTLVLWIDRTIQNIVETKLKKGIETYGAKEGSVVVMDPVTGGILAMASYPSYDPSAYHAWAKELYKNPIVASSYEPGSTFKALVMAKGIEKNVIQPTTIFNETGPVRIGEYTIRTWNNEYHGPITMTQVLEHSSNVGMVHVASLLRKEEFVSFLNHAGFGEPTNIDLEDEWSPAVRPEKEWTDIDLATASFGQGIAVTPIQMIRSIAAIANGGTLLEPHVVKEIQRPNGKTARIPAKKVRQLFSKKTTDVVTEMMVAAVDNGEAKWAKPKGYRIAGKTGTAQIPVSGHYDEKKTIASFVGFAPADHPRFVMLVTLREPTSSPWGSETAAPLFFAIAKELFLYLNIPTEL